MDTLELYDKLVAAEVPEKQARVISQAMDHQEDFAKRLEKFVTKDYLDAKLAPITSDLANLTWLVRGIGIILVGQIIATWLFGKHGP